MYKRPMILVLASYILGCFLSQLSIEFFFVISGIVIGILLYVWMLSKNRHDYILMVLPVFIIFGYIIMGQATKESQLYEWLGSESSVVEVIGEVDSMIATADSYKVIIKGAQVKGENLVTCNKLIFYRSDVSTLKIGNVLSVSGMISAFQKPTNYGQFDEYSYYKANGIDGKLKVTECKVLDKEYSVFRQVLYELRNKIKEVYYESLEEKAAGSLSAMVLGEKSLLDQEIKELYQAGGFSHVLVISGLHITLLGMAIYEFLHKLLGVKQGVFGAILVMFAYGVLTNFGVSTNRAVVMLTIMLMARVVFRSYDSMTALAFSALVILLQQPLQLFQSGFLLSYGAVIGAVVVYPTLRRMIPIQKNYILDTVLITFSIYSVTLPIVLYWFYEVPTYSVLANLCVLPLVSLVVMLGLVGGVMGCICPMIGTFLLGGAYYIMQFYQVVGEIVSSLPYHYYIVGRPGLLLISMYAILIVFGMRLLYKQNLRGIPIMVMAILILLWPSSSTSFRFTMLDVGQGDGIVVESEGQVYLIDGGSSTVNKVGAFRLIPYLKARGIRNVDGILLSHSDGDHISGVLELLESASLEGIRIEEVLITEAMRQDESYENLERLTKEENIKLTVMEQGERRGDYGLSILCLSRSAVLNANDSSMVLQVTYGQLDILCVGDLESTGENGLLDEGMITKCEILKVGHHGSRYSTSQAFLERVQPAVALISAGKNNSYGHPHKEVLERLEDVGSKVYETIHSGAITIESNGQQMWIHEMRNP